MTMATVKTIVEDFHWHWESCCNSLTSHSNGLLRLSMTPWKLLLDVSPRNQRRS